MRHNPAAGAIIIMLRSLKMHGMAQAVGELTEQGSPAFEAALPILSQLLKAETADREVRSTAYQLKAARFPNYRWRRSSGRSPRGSDQLGPALRDRTDRRSADFRRVFSHRLWKRNREWLVAASRSHGCGKPRHVDQAALPSVAVAAAARRSTLPSGPRGTASTAHSRSGAL